MSQSAGPDGWNGKTNMGHQWTLETDCGLKLEPRGFNQGHADPKQLQNIQNYCNQSVYVYTYIHMYKYIICCNPKTYFWNETWNDMWRLQGTFPELTWSSLGVRRPEQMVHVVLLLGQPLSRCVANVFLWTIMPQPMLQGIRAYSHWLWWSCGERRSLH